MALAAFVSALAVLISSQAIAAAPAAKASAAAPTATAAAVPIEFAGTLEAGRTYVAEVAFDNYALHIWRPARDVKVARDHAWTIVWTNLAAFPALKTTATRARPQRFTFKVAGVDVSSGGAPGVPWTTVYRCDIVAVEPMAGAQAPAAKRK